MLKYERKQGNWTLKQIFGLFIYFFLKPFWPYWVWAKKCLFFYNQISKNYFITLKTKFVTPNYKFMLHMTQIFILILILKKKKTI